MACDGVKLRRRSFVYSQINEIRQLRNAVGNGAGQLVVVQLPDATRAATDRATRR